MSTHNVAGQECDSEAYLVASLLEKQQFLQCATSLAVNYTFGNENAYTALAALVSLNASAFDALNQGDCSVLKTSILALNELYFYLSYVVESDSTAVESGLFAAYLKCVFPNETCNASFLNSTLYEIQYLIGCYLTLADGSYQPSEDQDEILDVLSAFYAAIANQCDTLNVSFFQLAYTLNRAAGLVYNGSETNVSDALTMCLFPEPTCSIEASNATLNKYEPVFDSLCELENLFNLTEPESKKLDDADIAYVEACLAVDGEDNCTVVSDDVQLFIDAIQEFIDYATGSNESSVDFVNAVKECANLSSTPE